MLGAVGCHTGVVGTNSSCSALALVMGNLHVFCGDEFTVNSHSHLFGLSDSSSISHWANYTEILSMDLENTVTHQDIMLLYAVNVRLQDAGQKKTPVLIMTSTYYK